MTLSQDVALESPQYLEGLVVGAYDRLSDDDLYGGLDTDERRFAGHQRRHTLVGHLL